MTESDSTTQTVSFWMNVDLFTVEQAAALWINADPSAISVIDSYNPPEYTAIKQMLTAGIITGELKADASINAFRSIGDHDKSLVCRIDLEAYARKRTLFPAFLFDTLAPFKQRNPFALNTTFSLPISQIPPHTISANRGGRPVEYDWDSFMMEIVRRANLPDGLPNKQAGLVQDMLSWFQTTFNQEPAESAVKARISKIYKYLNEAKNRSA